MEIYIGADHRGFELKNKLAVWLNEKGHNITDVGPPEYDKHDDYPDYGFKVAEAVGEQAAVRRGVVICGSGVGMAVVADKVPGVRAALVHDPKMAAAARNDDNVNVLALGADYISFEQACTVVNTWLSTEFAGEERHNRRLQKVDAYEAAGNGACDCSDCTPHHGDDCTCDDKDSACACDECGCGTHKNDDAAPLR